MTDNDRYYATLDRNGTEDEITIHAPDGRSLAFIWFWDEEDDDDPAKPEADRKKADALLIVDALNAYRESRPMPSEELLADAAAS